jgi:hypothetical protein
MTMTLEQAIRFRVPWIGKELRDMTHQDWRRLRNRSEAG